MKTTGIKLALLIISTLFISTESFARFRFHYHGHGSSDGKSHPFKWIIMGVVLIVYIVFRVRRSRN